MSNKLNLLLIFLGLLFSIPVFGQIPNTKKGAAILYTEGIPSGTPREKYDSEYAINISTGKIYRWKRSTGWVEEGSHIGYLNSSSAPTGAPGFGEPDFLINNDKELYWYYSSTWNCVNCASLVDSNGIYTGSNIVPDQVYAQIDSSKTFGLGQFPDFPSKNTTGVDRGFYYSSNVELFNGDNTDGWRNWLGLEPNILRLRTQTTTGGNISSAIMTAYDDDASFLHSSNTANDVYGTLNIISKLDTIQEVLALNQSGKGDSTGVTMYLGTGDSNSPYYKQEQRAWGVKTELTGNEEFHWISISLPGTEDTTGNNITFYEKYALPNAQPSVALADTSVVIWIGNGTTTVPQFAAYGSGSGGGSDGNGLFSASNEADTIRTNYNYFHDYELYYTSINKAVGLYNGWGIELVYDGSGADVGYLSLRDTASYLSAKTVYLARESTNERVSIGGVGAPKILQFWESNGLAAGQYVGLRAPTVLTVNNTYTLPNAFPGADDYALVSTTTGTMSWYNLATAGTDDQTLTADSTSVTGNIERWEIAIENGNSIFIDIPQGTVTSVGITDPFAGITSSGGPITTSGNITLALANDLAGLESISGLGIVARDDSSSYVVRTITGNSEINVSNGNGVAGNPTLSLEQQGATTGQVLKWNGSSWSPGTDNTGGSGSGEANRGANLGAGVGIYAGMSDTTLTFKSLTEGFGISLTASATEINIAVDTTNLATLTDIALNIDSTALTGGERFQIINSVGSVYFDVYDNQTIDVSTHDASGIHLSLEGDGEANKDITVISTAVNNDISFNTNGVYVDVSASEAQTLAIDSTIVGANERFTITLSGTSSTVSFDIPQGAADGNGIYDGNGTVPAGTVATLSTNFQLGSAFRFDNNSLDFLTAATIGNSGNNVTISSTAASTSAITINASGTAGRVVLQNSGSSATSGEVAIGNSTRTGGATVYKHLGFGSSYSPSSTGVGEFNYIFAENTINATGTADQDIRFINFNPTLTSLANGNISVVRTPFSFAAASGSGYTSLLDLSPTYNLTGTQSGIQRGIYINPTLTALVSAGQYRAIEITADNANAYGVWQTGTNTSNLLAGTTYIGGGATASSVLWYEGSAGGTDVTGFTGPTTLAGNQIYELPNDAPNDGEVLTWNTGGTLSWEVAGGAADGNGIYSGSGTVPGQTIATVTDTLVFKRDTSLTGGLTDILVFNASTSGTGASGFGPSLLFKSESASFDGREIARIGAGWTNATDANREGKISFQLGNNAGALAEIANLNVSNDNEGALSVGSANAVILTHATITPSQDYNFGGAANAVITLSSTSADATGGVRIRNTSSTSPKPVIIYGASTYTSTSLATDILSVGTSSSIYTAASGSGYMRGIEVTGVYNLTGTASGDQAGVYVNPTLTSLVSTASYRAFETPVNASNAWGVYQSGTSSSNLLAGTTYIGGGTSPSELRFYEGSAGGTEITGFVAPATLAADLMYTLPSTATDGFFLKYNTGGALTWESNATTDNNGIYTGSGTVPTHVQATVTDDLTFYSATDNGGGYAPVEIEVNAGNEPDFLKFKFNNIPDSLVFAHSDTEYTITSNVGISVSSGGNFSVVADSINISTVPTYTSIDTFTLVIGNSGFVRKKRNALIYPQYIAPEADHRASGPTIRLVANENQAFGDVCFINVDGEAQLGDADADSTAYCTVMCTETVTANNTATYIVQGHARDDTWAWTVGGLVYLSTTGTTGNTLTQTAPSATGDQVQIIGVATHADRILFNPDLSVVEIQ